LRETEKRKKERKKEGSVGRKSSFTVVMTLKEHFSHLYGFLAIYIALTAAGHLF
jgi:hypothetical protein